MDLQGAADGLGVHYQTAYRWVREGKLPALKKTGSTYEVAETDVARLRDERARPSPPPQTTIVRSWGAHQERFLRFLLAGEELGARRLVERLSDGGVEVPVLCAELFTPVLDRIGTGWAEGHVSIAVEHRAAAVCERLLARIAVHPRGRPRGVAVVCTSPSEEHSLPAAMAALCLRSDRWQVHHLGTKVPRKDLLALLGAVKADVLVLSRCNPDGDSAIEPIVAAATAAGVKVLVGGPGRSLRELLELARAA